jgi:hypothetical protein
MMERIRSEDVNAMDYVTSPTVMNRRTCPSSCTAWTGVPVFQREASRIDVIEPGSASLSALSLVPRFNQLRTDVSVCTRAIRVVIAVAVVAGVAGSAWAQDRPGVELSGGYQFLKLQSDTLDAAGVGTFFPVGWFFEAAAPVSTGLALAAQVGGHYRSESAPLMFVGVPGAADYSLNVHSFLAGARVVGRREDGLTAFFHVLAGATRVGLTLVRGGARRGDTATTARRRRGNH